MNEKTFVVPKIIQWLESNGWKISPITYERNGVDIKASKNGDQYIIECKGETKAEGIDFLTCVGQIISRMKQTSDTNYYGLGLPNTQKYKDLAKQQIPEQIRKKLKLRILFVNEDGQVQEIKSSEKLN